MKTDYIKIDFLKTTKNMLNFLTFRIFYKVFPLLFNPITISFIFLLVIKFLSIDQVDNLIISQVTEVTSSQLPSEAVVSQVDKIATDSQIQGTLSSVVDDSTAVSNKKLTLTPELRARWPKYTNSFFHDSFAKVKPKVKHNNGEIEALLCELLLEDLLFEEGVDERVNEVDERGYEADIDSDDDLDF